MAHPDHLERPATPAPPRPGLPHIRPFGMNAQGLFAVPCDYFWISIRRRLRGNITEDCQPASGRCGLLLLTDAGDHLSHAFPKGLSCRRRSLTLPWNRARLELDRPSEGRRAMNAVSDTVTTDRAHRRSPSTCARATSAAGPSDASGTASGRCPSCGTTCCWAPTPISSSPGSRPAPTGCGCCPRWCDRSTPCATWCRWSRCGACSVAARTRSSSPTSRRRACSSDSRPPPSAIPPSTRCPWPASGRATAGWRTCCSPASNEHSVRARRRSAWSVPTLRSGSPRSACPATGCTSCAPECPSPPGCARGTRRGASSTSATAPGPAGR